MILAAAKGLPGAQIPHARGLVFARGDYALPSGLNVTAVIGL
jgi:hypothetical protein